MICMRGSEGNGLLLEVVEVLIIDADNLELIKLSCLYVLDFGPLIFNFFSDLSTLFKVIESILLFDILVGGNLSSNFYRVVDESALLLLLDLALLLLDLLLFLDLEHVVLSFDSGLLSEGALLLLELHLSSNLKISLNPLLLLMLKSFSLPSLSLTLLECSLRSQSINLSLSISSLLLELSESLDFSFLLVLDSLSFELGFVLFLVSGFLIGDDFVLSVFFFLRSLFSLDQGLGVGFGSLLHQDVDPLSFGLSLLSIFLLHSLDVAKKLQPLLISDFLLLHSHNGSILNLIDNNLSSFISGLLLSLFSMLFFLEDLKSFDLHHEVEFFLFFDPLVLETLVFLQLLVSDGHNLGVENHLIHGLHIVEVVVKLFLSFRKQSFSLVLLSLLEFVWLNLSCSLGIHCLHLGFTELRFLLGSHLLLLEESFFGDYLFFSFD